MLRALVAAVLIACCSPAYAADDKQAAKDAYEAGRRHYDLGEYGEALSEFKKAYLNYAEPVFLFNIATCYRQLGDNKSAVRSYRAFLSNWPKAPNRTTVERIIGELESATTPAPEVGTTAHATRPATATTPPTSTRAGSPPARSAQAATTPRPSAPPPSVETSPPPRPAASRAEVTEMEEITPNFEQRSGSHARKKLKPWVIALTVSGVAVVVGGLIALVFIEARSAPGTAAGVAFTPTLPDFNAPAASRLSPVVQARF